MYSRIGAAAYKKDLTNTLALCAAIHNPQNHITTIHVAGTNGKGSTSHSLAAVLQQAGYKTGLYTSPHLHNYRERIRINGEMITEAAVLQFMNKIVGSIDAIAPSFFEITVALAYDYFKQEQVDIAIIETGLGGRLDSTNIITPILSIITNISYDHQNILGNTLTEIATEKAGIIKKNVPVIIGAYTAETLPVFIQKALQENARLIIATDAYNIISTSDHNTLLECVVQNNDTKTTDTYQLDLAGLYQANNLITILTAIDALRLQGWHITNLHITNALKQVTTLTGLLGRWQVILQAPKVVLDVAHNIDGITQIVRQIEAHKAKLSKATIHIILGMVQDKDITAVLQLLPQDAQYYYTQAHIPRALAAAELQAMAHKAGLVGHVYNNVNMALAYAKTVAYEQDLILVCGSIFLVGEVEV